MKNINFVTWKMQYKQYCSYETHKIVRNEDDRIS